MKPEIPQAGAVDLSEMARVREANAKLAEAAEESQEAEAAERRVRAWDRAMQRAFKGILPRPQRHYLLGVALERHEAER